MSANFKPKDEQAAEDMTTILKLKSWGIPIEIADPELEKSGYGFLRNRIEVEVNRAVEQAVGVLRRRWGPETIEEVRQDAVPDNFMEAETRTLHEALDAYHNHLRDTGKRDQDGELSSRTRKCQDRLRYLKEPSRRLSLVEGQPAPYPEDGSVLAKSSADEDEDSLFMGSRSRHAQGIVPVPFVA